jgi:hypothetical protein
VKQPRHTGDVQVQAQLLNTKWTQEELAMDNCQQIWDTTNGKLLFAGIRVRMGIFWAVAGSIVALSNNDTATFDVRGPGMDAAVALSEAAHGGQTVLTDKVWKKVCHVLGSVMPQ